MSNRTYRLLFGITVLTSLYFGQLAPIYGLVGMAVFEAISNLRLPCLLCRLRGYAACDPREGSLGIDFPVRIGFEAERAWRLLVAAMLFISVFVFPEALWFFPWFMGFAITGAGISGVCPVFLALRWTGLR